MTNASLKKKSIVAVMWSGVEVFMRQGLQFIVAIVLARILTPEEFGTVALLYLFTGIAGVFIDSGFSAALIQKQDCTINDESTVFWFNLITGIIFSVLLWLSAPSLANYFEVAILIPLTKVISISLFINALGAVQFTLFTKGLDFKILMKIGVISTIISGMVAIVLAYNDYGVWALAFQIIVASIMNTLLLWLLSSWRPKFVFSMKSLKSLFGFGGYLMLSALLDVAYNRVYSLLIGKYYGVRELGFYTRADNTKQIPADLLSSTFDRVAFPVFSVAAHNKNKLKRGAQLAVRGMMLINIPMMIGLLVTSENTISVIFGEKWLPAAPLLQVLCLAGIFWPLHVINLNILKAMGYSHLFFRLEIIKKIIGVGFLFVGMMFGVIGLAWSQVFYGLFGFFINAYYTRVYLGYGVIEQVSDFFPGLFISSVMGGVVYLIGLYGDMSKPVILTIQILGGVSVFTTLSIIFNTKAYHDSKQLFLSRNN